MDAVVKEKPTVTRPIHRKLGFRRREQQLLTSWRSAEELPVEIHFAAPGAEHDAAAIWRSEWINVITRVKREPVPRTPAGFVRPDVRIAVRIPEYCDTATIV